MIIFPEYVYGAHFPYETAAEGTGADVVMLVLYIMLALVFSFLCSVAEAALLSITPSYIEVLKEKHPKRAALLQRLKQDNVDQSLAAILTLNTIAHTVGAIGAGAKATVVFGSTWFGIFSAVMTLLILFVSEIIPKTVGAVYWQKLVGPTALFVRMLIAVLYPIVWISQRLTQYISRGTEANSLGREEVIAMASLGVESGNIRSSESKIISSLLRFESLKVDDIMTPRTVITALPEETTINDSLQLISKTPFSRIPVYKSNIDKITGFVLKGDVLIHSTENRGDDILSSLKREILFLPETVPLSTVFDRFFRERQHIAIVVNEHGGTEGLVTLEDLIETIMGMEIVDETDNVKDMRILARKKWVERARALGINEDAWIDEKLKKNDSEGDKD